MDQKLTIQVVGWNSAKVLPATLAALATIPRREAVICYIDNASTDNSVQLVKAALPAAHIIELTENRGFAGAHNAGLADCATPLVLTLDPDLVVYWDGLKRLLSAFAKSEVAAVQGKIYRAHGKVIDSAGIVQTLALNGRERGSSEIDRGQYEQPAKLLAVTGAGGLFRMTALKNVAEADGRVFDEDFFAYKEDVDLGWRLNNSGWEVIYLPILFGRHKRTLGREGIINWGVMPKQIIGRLKNPRTRYSLRNWVWMIAKNATLRQDIRAEIFIDARLILFFGFSLLYWPLLPVWPEIARGLPTMLRKRMEL